MSKIFTEDLKKDMKLIGKSYTLKGIDKTGIDLKGKLVDITVDGYYVFKITTKDSEWEEFTTKIPNNGDVL